MTTASYVAGTKIQEIQTKSCVLPEQCGENSVNFGVAKTVIVTKCCTSDLCNNKPAPGPREFTPNGKKCFYCDDKTCTHTLDCAAGEDYCISSAATVGTVKQKLKGCASEQVCSAPNEIISCCEGNLCNSATTTGAALLLLVAPLVSLVMIS